MRKRQSYLVGRESVYMELGGLRTDSYRPSGQKLATEPSMQLLLRLGIPDLGKLNQSQHFAGMWMLAHQVTRCLLGSFEPVAVTHNISNPKEWNTELSGAEYLAGAAQLQVFFSNHKPIT